MTSHRNIAAALLALPLAACVAGPAPEIATPTPELPGQFYQDPGGGGSDVAALLPLDDPAYGALAAQALAQSPALGQALARVEAARARSAGRKSTRLNARH